MNMLGKISPGKEKSEEMIAITKKETIINFDGLKLANTPVNPDSP